MFKRMDAKSLLQFFICGIGGYAIFYVLFCRASFYDAFLIAMDLSNTQFGVMYSVYGWIAAVTYFVGGIIADKVSPRMMMFLSFVGTGICNFILGLFPGYGVCVVLYAVMAITTTVTFWAAMLKCVRIIGRRVGDENGVYGWFEGTRGIAGIVIGFIVVWGFNRFANLVMGLRFVIWVYAFLLIIFGILSLIVFDKDEDRKEVQAAKEARAQRLVSKKSPWRLFVDCIKSPDIWICTAIAIGGYNVGSCIGSYYGDAISSCFGASLAATTYLGLMNDWFKPVGAFLAAIFTRKKGPSWILKNVTWVYVVIIAVMLILPKEPKYLWVYVALLAIEIACTGAFRGQQFATLSEAGVLVNETGTATGVMSTIIYSTDAFMPIFIGIWLDSFSAVKAYNMLYYVLLASCAVTLVFVYIHRKRHKDNIAMLLNEERAAVEAPAE